MCRSVALISIMGLSLSSFLSAWEEIATHRLFGLGYNLNFTSKNQEIITFKRTDSIKRTDSETINNSNLSNKFKRKNSISLKNCEPIKVMLEKTLSFKNLVHDITSNTLNPKNDGLVHKSIPTTSLLEPAIMFSPRPVSELDAAAIKLQKVYKSYRTRRNLADCAVVVEELWFVFIAFSLHYLVICFYFTYVF